MVRYPVTILTHWRGYNPGDRAWFTQDVVALLCDRALPLAVRHVAPAEMVSAAAEIVPDAAPAAPEPSLPGMTARDDEAPGVEDSPPPPTPQHPARPRARR